MFLLLSYYFFRLIFVFPAPLATLYTASEVTSPSENADNAVVVAVAVATIPNNGNMTHTFLSKILFCKQS